MALVWITKLTKEIEVFSLFCANQKLREITDDLIFYVNRCQTASTVLSTV